MSADNISQHAEVSGHARVGSIFQIGKLVIQFILHPAAWQDAVWSFATTHPRLILASVIFEVALGSVHWRFADRYLIRPEVWALAAGLLLAAVWGWNEWLRPGRTRWPWRSAVLFSSALAGLLMAQTWAIAYPKRFAPDVFGIVVAELGEGAGLRRTELAQDISKQIYDHLCDEIRRNQEPQPEGNQCGQAEAGSGPRVQVIHSGVIGNGESAQAEGRRLGADMVIWGQLLVSQSGQLTLYFHLLETPQRVSSPEFPAVLPVTAGSADVVVTSVSVSPAVAKTVVAQQLQVVSAFTLGLADYYHLNMPDAHRHLREAATGLEVSGAQAALPSGPGQSLLLFYLGQAQYDLGLIKEGQATLQQAQRLNPVEPALPLSLALGDRSLNKRADYTQHMAQALALVETWLTDHPDDVAALYDRAVIYHAQDLFVDARLDYAAVIRLDPTFYVAYLGLGQTARSLGDHALAEAAFNQAIQLAETAGSNAAWAYLNLALAYAESGQPQRAEEAFRQALLAAPEVQWMYYYYAQFLRQQSQADAAVLVYDRLIAVAHNKGWAYAEKAEYLKEIGLPQAAIDSFLRALHEEPENALFHAYLADLYAAQGDLLAAREHYEKAEVHGPNIMYVLLAFAGFLAGQQEHDQAISLYQRSLVQEPQNTTALLNLGQAYESAHQPEQAMALYEHIVAMSDQLPGGTVEIAQERLERLRGPGLRPA